MGVESHIVRPGTGKVGCISAARARGFTAIELMVTIAIGAILLAVAAPSFRGLIVQQRMKVAASAITESLWLARGEALKRNGDVSFKFVDINHEWNITLGSTGTGTVLHHQDAQTMITSTPSPGWNGVFTFNAYGRLSSGSGAWVQLNDVQTGAVKCISVSSTGRASVRDLAC
ncbi:MAG TPA: GspH/FimT family pseudopilin [Burkholderiaceae bacterium]|nr:GspH/FimT family pseudopilin [Burkholderiaceae bacterium]